MPRAGGSRVLRFGVFELDENAAELRKRGIKIKLGGQPLKILLTLASRPGQVVTREDLRGMLWDEGIHVDYEHSLNKAVNRLREVLGDSPDHPVFLETIPRRGYRFVAPVEVVRTASNGGPEAGAAVVPAPAVVTPPPLRGRFLWPVVLVLAASTAAAVGILISGREAAHGVPLLSPIPLTSVVGRETSAVFSPDGSRIAFVWDGEDQNNVDIYILNLREAHPLRLTTFPGMDYSPAWAPDGSRIAFLRNLDRSRAGVFLTSPAPKTEVQVAEVTAPPAGYASFVIPNRSLAWTRDARALLVSDAPRPEGPFAIFRVPLAGGERVKLTDPPPNTRGDLSPTVSPDGSRIAFIRGGVAQAGQHIELLEAGPAFDGLRPSRRLNVPQRWIESIEWSPDSRAVLYSAADSLDGSRSLYYASISEASPPVLIPGLGPDSTHPAVSRDRRSLVYTRQFMRQSSIWRLPLASFGRAGGEPRIALRSTSRVMDADISPDGKRLAFRSLRSGVPEIWLSGVDGSGQRCLTRFGAEGSGNPRWAPDGQRIAFHARVEGSSDIYVYDLRRNTHVRLTNSGPSNPIIPTWSRDGGYIYFSSNRSGTYQIYRVPVSGGEPVQVTREQGACLLESPRSGAYYFTAGYYQPKLKRLAAAGGVESDTIASVLNSSSFAVTSEGIYYISASRPDGTSSIRAYRFDSGATTNVLDLPKAVESGLSISADGRWLVYSQIDQEETTLMLAETLGFWRR